ncbi:MAG: superoxide dismutase [Planctomycetota bacterium]
MHDDLTRREALKTAAVVTGAILAGDALFIPATARAEGGLEQPPLPYPKDALAPANISAETLDYHYGKHHKGYYDNLNKMPEAKGKSLEELVKSATKDTPLFNNAGQAWNHDFYWQSLKPDSAKHAPKGKLAELIKTYGGVDKVKTDLTAAAMGQFGSGWAWLVLDGDKLAVEKTSNADTPLAHGKKPLLTIDVWEHAYYIDFRNKRADYVKSILDHLINWEFAEKGLG